MRVRAPSLFTFFKAVPNVSNNQARNISSSIHSGPDQILPADDFRAWAPDAAVSLRIKDSGPQSAAPISVPSLFKKQVENLPSSLALRAKGSAGQYFDWTWTDYYISGCEESGKGFHFSWFGTSSHGCLSWTPQSSITHINPRCHSGRRFCHWHLPNK